MKDFEEIILEGVILGMTILFAGCAFMLVLCMIPYLYIFLMMILKNISTILTILLVVLLPIVLGVLGRTAWWLIGNKRK